MKYYTIQNDNILIADKEETLSRYYDYIQDLPEDYVPGKYIIGEKEIEIDVPDYDEEGNPIMIDYEDVETVIEYDDVGTPIGTKEITVIKQKQSTHKETTTIKTLVPNPNWEEEQAQKEAERIAKLSLTRGDVFRGILQAKGVTKAQIRANIEAMSEGLQKEMALIDFDDALNFYRGNALIDTLGATLSITKAQLDKFFQTNDYHDLMTVESQPEIGEDEEQE